jgi:epoxyqueuosine reductase
VSVSRTRRRLDELAARHGLHLVGVTSADPMPADRERMEASVAAGRMARMGWMGGSRAAQATDPRRHDPDARSVITVAAPYVGLERAAWDDRPRALHDALATVLGGSPAEPAGRIARYAIGSDYHGALRGRLEGLAADLRASGIAAGDTAYVDDRPLAERALAARGGLGWIGKNTNLLTHQPAGSWVFLGAILTSADLPVDAPVRTSCGSCTRCLSGCPTGALVAPQRSTRGAASATSQSSIPGRLMPGRPAAIGDWIFGCDVCQEVCPVNGDANDSGPLLVPLLPLIEWLLPIGTRAFDRALAATALTRAGRHRLLRNAIAALGNAGPPSDDSRRLLERAARDRREEVRAQAAAVHGRSATA